MYLVYVVEGTESFSLYFCYLRGGGRINFYIGNIFAPMCMSTCPQSDKRIYMLIECVWMCVEHCFSIEVLRYHGRSQRIGLSRDFKLK